MKRKQLFLSTIDPEAGAVAAEYGLGVEIAEFCTAMNMDEDFPVWDAKVRSMQASRCVFHGPFSELFPCAIDPRARELARDRYAQAQQLAVAYGAEKLVLHGGYLPNVYFPQWYTEQSVLFWKEFLPRVQIPIALENVMEEQPELLAEIAAGVGDPRFGLCLDLGHLHVCSKVSAQRWLEVCGPYVTHFHIHNNDGTRDSHSGLGEGTLPMKALLEMAGALCPAASYTVETTCTRADAQWLLEEGLLEGSV